MGRRGQARPAVSRMPGEHVRHPVPDLSVEVTVSVNLKKVVTWLLLAFVIFYVIRSPEDSARLVRNAGHALGDAASSLAAFVGSLV
jgi:hypothetical protein